MSVRGVEIKTGSSIIVASSTVNMASAAPSTCTTSATSASSSTTPPTRKKLDFKEDDVEPAGDAFDLDELLLLQHKMMDCLARLNQKTVTAFTACAIMGKYGTAANIKNLVVSTIDKIDRIVEATAGLEFKELEESNNQ